MENVIATVTTLREGETGVVSSIGGSERLTSRLASMGIIPGIEIKVLRKSAGSVIVLASDTRLALGRIEASRIFVSGVPVEEKKSVLVALAGQPNVGKSTVFNILTGLSQHVGNWPGKTVEKKEGVHIADGAEMRIVDLPGTYSLTAFSEEERAAREFIIHEHPDVIVLVANASALERSLYLLTEVLLLDVPIVVAVNMTDVAENQGIHVDVEALQRSLGLPVVSIIATKNKGIKELVPLIIDASLHEVDFNPRLPDVSFDHRAIYMRLLELLKGHVPPPYADRWVATKLMEGDHVVSVAFQEILPQEIWTEIQGLLIEHEDALRAVVGGRYDWIEMVTRIAVSRFRRGQVLMTDRIDHLLTQPVLGIPLLLGILALVFVLTYRVGFPLQHGLERLLGLFARLVETGLAGAPPLAHGARGKRHHRRRGLGAHVLSHTAHILCLPNLSRRRRLHGKGRLCDGPLHARGRPPREELHPPVPGLRLQRAFRHRDADRGVEESAPSHHIPRAFHPLHCQARGAYLRLRGRVWGARVPCFLAASHCQYRRPRRHGHGDQQGIHEGRAYAFHHGASPVPQTRPAHHRGRCVGEDGLVREAGGQRDPGCFRGDLARTSLGRRDC